MRNPKRPAGTKTPPPRPVAAEQSAPDPSIFRSAVTGSDGTVDPGYLAMAVGVGVWTLASVAILLLGTTAINATKDHAATLQAVGIALGAVSGGFATMLGAVGLFRMGDKPHPNTVTTAASSTTTATTQPGG